MRLRAQKKVIPAEVRVLRAESVVKSTGGALKGYGRALSAVELREAAERAIARRL